MRRKYNKTTAWVAKTKAVEHKQIKRTVIFGFMNQAVTHRNIGVAFKGFSAWSAALDYRIAEVPPALRGAILVDNASVGLKRNTFFKEEYVRQRSYHPYKFKKPSSDKRLSVLTFDLLVLNGFGLGHPYKFKKPSSDKRLSVLTRRDLKIFLFAHSDDVGRLVSREITKTPYKIALQNTEQSIELQGLEINNYCEIPLDKITQKFFFVIRKI